MAVAFRGEGLILNFSNFSKKNVYSFIIGWPSVKFVACCSACIVALDKYCPGSQNLAAMRNLAAM